jgi:hypothetical protein
VAEEEDEKKPFVIKVANLDDPKPFETRQGAFHGYTYIPLLGWLPPTELNIIIFVIGLALAILLPVYGKHRLKVKDAGTRESLAQAANLPELDLRFHGKDASVAVLKDADDRGGWGFDWDKGRIYINCTHTDARGTAWTAY